MGVTDLVIGADGRARCAWGASTPDYTAYHDDEWGRPVRGDDALFERITLEAFQSGLSWLTILRKRPAFRPAFDDFRIARVAAYGAADVHRLLADAGHRPQPGQDRGGDRQRPRRPGAARRARRAALVVRAAAASPGPAPSPRCRR